MKDECQGQLEGRIAALRDLRVGIQDQLRDLHHELHSLERRIQRAETMYRDEYGQEPPAGDKAVKRRTRRRAEPGQPSWRDAMAEVLRREGPLHVKTIWKRLEESGFETAAADPLRPIVSIAVRHPDQFRRVAPNTYALNGAANPQEEEIRNEPRAHEPEA